MPQATLLKIGVVGFSRNAFDKKAAQLKLQHILEQLTIEEEVQSFEIVSGYTASGVPQIAYRLADAMGIPTVGFSAKQALRVKSGLHPVQKVILVGERFGDESIAFIEYIDVLIRIGGGSQSRHEVELFKKKYKEEEWNGRLFEEEVAWFGN